MASFSKRVISIVNKIPVGKVTTYGTIATMAGIPRAARLVGGILHAKETEISWQRVVNRHGFISTKCLEFPKPLQKALLEQEGIEVSKDFMIDLTKYGWP